MGETANEFGQQAWQAATILQIAGRTVREAEFDANDSHVLAVDEDAAVFSLSSMAHAVAAEFDAEPTVGWWLVDGNSTDPDACAIWLAQAGQDPDEFDCDHAAVYDNGVFVPYAEEG